MTTTISEQLPPQDLEAERGVIGGVCFDNRQLDELPGLRPDHFYLESHRRMWAAIASLHAKGGKYDIITLSDELKSSGGLKDCGGYEYMKEVIEAVPHAAHTVSYGRIVVEKAMRRSAIATGADLVAAGFNPTADLGDSIAETEAKLRAIHESQVDGAATPISDVALSALIEIQTPQATPLSTGFGKLNEMLAGGLRPGQIVVLAARPGVGKTAFAGNVAGRAARAGVPTLLFSLEQSKAELFSRFLTSETGMSGEYIASGNVSPNHMTALEFAANNLGALPLLIDDHAHRTVSHIAAQSRLHYGKDGVRLVIVDYLQLITPENKRDNRETQVAEISRNLKVLARSLGVPIIVLAQLNREIEKREGKARRPRLSDLRESGAIEQDADIVIFLDRPHMYDATAPEVEAKAIVAKHRNGRTGTVDLLWFGDKMKFEDPAPDYFGG